MIISISGKIGTGKDTLARFIQELQPEKNWQIKKWAGKLKEVASVILNVPIEKWEDHQFKDTMIGDAWYDEVLGRSLTYREFIQRLGTEGGRMAVHKNIWVNSLLDQHWKECKDGEPYWIISDTRFPNEAEAVRKMGYPLVLVTRESGYKSTHESETALDYYSRFDFEVDNDGSLERLKNYAGTILESIERKPNKMKPIVKISLDLA